VSPTFLAWRTCEVCGHAANEPEVQPRVLLIADGGTGVFVDIIQCRKVAECRVRCEAAGREWPALDSEWLSRTKRR